VIEPAKTLGADNDCGSGHWKYRSRARRRFAASSAARQEISRSLADRAGRSV
jgi:hypothetical protein